MKFFLLLYFMFKKKDKFTLKRKQEKNISCELNFYLLYSIGNILIVIDY